MSEVDCDEGGYSCNGGCDAKRRRNKAGACNNNCDQSCDEDCDETSCGSCECSSSTPPPPPPPPPPTPSSPPPCVSSVGTGFCRVTGLIKELFHSRSVAKLLLARRARLSDLAARR